MEAEGWSFEPGAQEDVGKQTRRFFRLRGKCTVVDGRIVGYVPEEGEDMALWKNQVRRKGVEAQSTPTPTPTPTPAPTPAPAPAPAPKSRPIPTLIPPLTPDLTLTLTSH